MALSIARGAGKSTLTAGIACATVDGPLMQRRAETVIVASSFTQSRIVYEHVLAFLRELGHDLDDRKQWRLQDSQNAATVEHRATGARVRCIGSDPARAHGLAPALVIADEPAQWPGSTSERMRAALVTSMGKIDGSRFIALGTRPADRSHWFQSMLDGGAAYAQTHAARESDPPFQLRTWVKANPSLTIMPALLKRVRQEAADAKRDPSLLAGFKALRLNLGLDDTLQSTLLDAGTWERCEGEAERRGPFVLGIDLGGAASMSAAASYWPDSGAAGLLSGASRARPTCASGDCVTGAGGCIMDMFRQGGIDPRGRAGRRRGGIARRSGPEAMERAPPAITCDRWRVKELRGCARRGPLPAVRRCWNVGKVSEDGGEDVQRLQDRDPTRAGDPGAFAPAALRARRGAGCYGRGRQFQADEVRRREALPRPRRCRSGGDHRGRGRRAEGAVGAEARAATVGDCWLVSRSHQR